MFEKFTTANARDFAQRYQGTFGFFRNDHEKKAPMLCKLTIVENQIKFVNRQGMEYTLNPDVEEQIGFHFLPPRAGFFNTDEGVLYVHRLAARQFQRGITDRNTRIYKIGEAGFKQVPVNFLYLEKIFESKVTESEAIYSFMEGKTTTVALTPQFAVNGTKLFVLDAEIGSVTKVDRFNWKVKLSNADLFRTEVNDALKNYVKVEFQ